MVSVSGISFPKSGDFQENGQATSPNRYKRLKTSAFHGSPVFSEYFLPEHPARCYPVPMTIFREISATSFAIHGNKLWSLSIYLFACR
jgi:hypothetical protein